MPLVFCLLVACERRHSSVDRADASTSIVDTMPSVPIEEPGSSQDPQPVPVQEEGCGCSPSGLLARVAGLTCDEAGAQTYRLLMHGPSDGSAFPSRASVGIHHKFMGFGARMNTVLTVPVNERQQQWFECEYRAGRRPALEVRFCLPADSPGGLTVDLTLSNGDVEHLDGANSARAAQLLEVIDATGARRVLNRTVFTVPQMSGDDETVNALHIAGTPSFTERSGSLNDFSGFGAPRRHRRRH